MAEPEPETESPPVAMEEKRREKTERPYKRKHQNKKLSEIQNK